MACKTNDFIGYLYFSFFAIWLIFTLWWIFNTWVVNRNNSKSIQKVIALVIILKTLYIGFYSGSKLYCNTDEDEAYWGLAITSTFALYNTFVYTLLALISRGFCLIRETLDRIEVTSIALIMGVVYLSFSSYLITPSDLGPYLIIVLGYLFYLNVKNSIKNIKFLQARYHNLRQANILPMLPGVLMRLSVFKKFLFFSYIFYLNEIAYFSLECIGNTYHININDSFWLYTVTVQISLLTITSFSIYVIYRSKSQFVDFDDSFAIPNEPHQIAPIYVAGPNNITESDSVSISIIPYMTNTGNTYLAVLNRLMVAIPLK